MWLCVLLIPMLVKWRGASPWGLLASQPSLLRKFQVTRDFASPNKINSTWSRVGEVASRAPLAHATIHTYVPVHTDMYIYIYINYAQQKKSKYGLFTYEKATVLWRKRIVTTLEGAYLKRQAWNKTWRWILSSFSGKKTIIYTHVPNI